MYTHNTVEQPDVPLGLRKSLELVELLYTHYIYILQELY